MVGTARAKKVALGLDFGTESVRALLVDLDGKERGSAVVPFRHGQITETLPSTGARLPPDFALQHPSDWVDSAARAVRQAMRAAKLSKDALISIGVDFTACTMLPTASDGTPLCLLKQYEKKIFAWPKLWKHHGAKSQTDKINQVARQRRETWLKRYGGIIGLEWMFPKILETLEGAPAIYKAADVWIEAGDWFVWQLVGSRREDLPRSTCMAGYKAMWGGKGGYPSEAYFAAVDSRLKRVVAEKMPGRLLAPGELAGELTPAMAKRFGLSGGIPVSAAIIDAHAGVPGAGAADAGTLVMVIGTSSCHMLNGVEEKHIPGVAAVAKGGILPGYYGYETGQAAVGDAFDWLRRMLGQKGFGAWAKDAAALPPGADGVRCLDWFNGCRTPHMDGSLRGAFNGLTLNHGPQHLYRSLLEASAFGLRWNVEILRRGGVPVTKCVATGGLPHHNPFLVQVYADVLGEPITVHPSQQGPALGAAILGVLAAPRRVSGFSSAAAAIRAMADPRNGPGPARVVRPNRRLGKEYDTIYKEYRDLAASTAGKR